MKKELIIGTMKSAKSAQLIIKGYQLDKQGKKVLTLKPEIDTRDGEYVVSRALPTKRPATVISHDTAGMVYILRLVAEQKPEVILVDELQFFTVDQIEMLGLISVNYDIDIYTYGIMMSFNGFMFEPIRRALECGFRMSTIDMACDLCSNDATHHLLWMDGELQTKGEAISVEDFKNKKQEYKSVCFSCYKNEIDKHNHKK